MKDTLTQYFQELIDRLYPTYGETGICTRLSIFLGNYLTNEGLKLNYLEKNLSDENTDIGGNHDADFYDNNSNSDITFTWEGENPFTKLLNYLKQDERKNTVFLAANDDHTYLFYVSNEMNIYLVDPDVNQAKNITTITDQEKLKVLLDFKDHQDCNYLELFNFGNARSDLKNLTSKTSRITANHMFSSGSCYGSNKKRDSEDKLNGLGEQGSYSRRSFLS